MPSPKAQIIPSEILLSPIECLHTSWEDDHDDMNFKEYDYDYEYEYDYADAYDSGVNDVNLGHWQYPSKLQGRGQYNS